MMKDCFLHMSVKNYDTISLLDLVFSFFGKTISPAIYKVVRIYYIKTIVVTLANSLGVIFGDSRQTYPSNYIGRYFFPFY